MLPATGFAGSQGVSCGKGCGCTGSCPSRDLAANRHDWEASSPEVRFVSFDVGSSPTLVAVFRHAIAARWPRRIAAGSACGADGGFVQGAFAPSQRASGADPRSPIIPLNFRQIRFHFSSPLDVAQLGRVPGSGPGSAGSTPAVETISDRSSVWQSAALGTQRRAPYRPQGRARQRGALSRGAQASGSSASWTQVRILLVRPLICGRWCNGQHIGL